MSLDEPHFHRSSMQATQIGLEVICTFMSEFKDVNDDGAVLLRQHARKRQAISAIIAFAAVNGETTIEITLLFQPGKATFCSTFHQTGGSDWLIFYGKLIPG